MLPPFLIDIETDIINAVIKQMFVLMMVYNQRDAFFESVMQCSVFL